MNALREFCDIVAENNVLLVGPRGCGKTRMLAAYMAIVPTTRSLYLGMEQFGGVAERALAALASLLACDRSADGASSEYTIETMITDRTAGGSRLAILIDEMETMPGAEFRQYIGQIAQMYRPVGLRVVVAGTPCLIGEPFADGMCVVQMDANSGIDARMEDALSPCAMFLVAERLHVGEVPNETARRMVGSTYDLAGLRGWARSVWQTPADADVATIKAAAAGGGWMIFAST